MKEQILSFFVIFRWAKVFCGRCTLKCPVQVQVSGRLTLLDV